MTEDRLVRLVGGPLDGREISTDPDAAEAVVTMADRTQHYYRADEASDSDRPPGSSTFVYSDVSGRCNRTNVPTCSLSLSSWPGQAVSQVAGGSLLMCLPRVSVWFFNGVRSAGRR